MDLDFQDILDAFADMRSAGWNVEGPLKWGQCFFDPERERLEALAKELETQGWRTEGYEITDEGDGYVLTVSKVGTYSPDGAYALGESLEALAEKHGVESYDGWEAEPV